MNVRCQTLYLDVHRHLMTTYYVNMMAEPVLSSHGITGFWNINTASFLGLPDKLELYRYFRVNCFPSVDEFYEAFYETINQTDLTYKVRQALLDFNPSMYLSEHKIYTDSDRTFRYIRDEVLGGDNYVRVMDKMTHNAGLEEYALTNKLWMRTEHIRDLSSKGHFIGLHTHKHPTRIDLEPSHIQRQEYTKNHEILSDILGKNPVSMSHPNGRYTINYWNP